ncbi:AAA family ATPase [[Actinomadura] parvosata]|uniref:AAA family ATPase n=1 Tax=[Actinomadura] parvosata TaxID=1955412 RepID=UPI00406D4D2E
MAELIGRERPAAILRGEVERALVSHGALVLVTGEAGIGKSALVAGAAEEAVRGGARLLTGACWEGEGAPGHWPWVQVVRQLAPEVSLESLAAGREAFQLYDAVTALLVEAARERPVVVVLEDLHWADPASLRLLEFVVRHAWFERLLVIGTYRDAEVDGPLSLPLEAKAVTLTLTGLDVEGVGRLVTRTTGVVPEPELVAQIHRRTGGNPFFVEQTARLWQGGSPLATIPPGVGAAIRRRLSRLAGEVLKVLRMAAVLGREFTTHTLTTALTSADASPASAPTPISTSTSTSNNHSPTTISPSAGALSATTPPSNNDSAITTDPSAYGGSPTSADPSTYGSPPTTPTGPSVGPPADGAPAATSAPNHHSATTTGHSAGDSSAATWPSSSTRPSSGALPSSGGGFLPEGQLRAPAMTHASPSPVLKALGQAVAAKLVVSHGSGRYAFVHDLVRETLYADLDDTSRVTLHAAALAALDTAPPATRAHHACLAAAPEAVDLLLAAARDAEGRMADEEAVGHYRRALDLTPAAEPRRRATIGFDLSTAQHRAGDAAAGARTLESALALTRHLNAPDLLAIAALKVHDLSFTGGGRWTAFVHDAHHKLVNSTTPPPSVPITGLRVSTNTSPNASTGTRTSTRMGTGPDRVGRDGGGGPGRSHEAWAGTRRMATEDRLHAAARDLTEVAADLARHGEDDRALAYSLLSRLGVIWSPGSTAERLAITEELSAVADRVEDDQLDLAARSWRVGALLELGDPRCLSEQRAFTSRAESSGLRLFEHEAAVLRAMFATLTGRFDEAETHIDAAYELGEQPGIGRHDLRWMQRWSAALLRGRFDVAETVLAEMEQAGSPHFPLYRAVTAMQRGGGDVQAATAVRQNGDSEPEPATATQRGRDTEAQPATAVQRGGDGGVVLRYLAEIMAEGEQYLRWMAPLWLRFQAQAAARSRDPVLCERARAAIAPYVGQWGVTATVAVEGPYAHWMAVLDAAQERWDEAVAGFTAAYQAADILGARPWSVESRARLAEVLQARGDDASALIEQVEREAAELGMVVRLPRPRAGSFRFDGAVWVLTFVGRTVHLPDSKGLADLRVLLARPGRDVPAVELLDPAGGEVVVAARGMGGDDVLDEEARVRYRRRLELLDEEIDRAVELGEERRAADLDAERQALLDELRTATGLGGRPRRLGDEAERARKAVTNRIRNTLRLLDHRHPELAAHLRASISTGSTCSYRPAPEVHWAT